MHNAKFMRVITIGSALLVLFSLCNLPLSAAEDYNFTLRELFDAGQIYIEGYSGTESYSLSHNYNWDNALQFFTPSGMSLMTFRIDINSNQNTLFTFIADDSVLSLRSGMIALYGDFGGAPNLSDCNPRMRMGFRVELEDGTFKYFYTPWQNFNRYNPTANYNREALEFPPINYSVNLPDGSKSIYSILMEFDDGSNGIDHYFDLGSASMLVKSWGSGFDFFVGPLSYAPDYGGASFDDTSDYIDKEDALLNDAQSGLSYAGDIVGGASDALVPGSDIYNGVAFWGNLFRVLTSESDSNGDGKSDGIVDFNTVLTISLALGTVLVVFGVIFDSFRRK